jgi:3' terminal RNA ribose 2'-O-methyltransferase Hen1
MLLTITTTHAPATDLGYLLHKHPARVQTFDLSCGQAHVFYPEASSERCTAALLLDIDPWQLAQTRHTPASDAFVLQPYVNDRPYVASSLLSVAIGEVFGTALSGRCNARPELVVTPLPLEARLAVLRCAGGESMLRCLFEPLGYYVSAERYPLDERMPAWGDSEYYTVTLTGTLRLYDLLSHLYVLVPVLDDAKHYWIGEDEVAKLLRHGDGWLVRHPERELIARRYLKHQRGLTDAALTQLADDDDGDPDATESQGAADETRLEASIGPSTSVWRRCWLLCTPGASLVSWIWAAATAHSSAGSCAISASPKPLAWTCPDAISTVRQTACTRKNYLHNSASA